MSPSSTMTDPRSAELKRRLRQQEGRDIRRQWIQSLRAATATVVSTSDLLDLDRTESLRDQFFGTIRRPKGAFRGYWPAMRRDAIESVLHKLSQNAGDSSIILFSSVDRRIGAVQIAAHSVLTRPFDVWEVVQQDLSFCTFDLANGLCLELNHLDWTGNHADTYEMTSWGQFIPS